MPKTPQGHCLVFRNLSEFMSASVLIGNDNVCLFSRPLSSVHDITLHFRRTNDEKHSLSRQFGIFFYFRALSLLQCYSAFFLRFSHIALLRCEKKIGKFKFCKKFFNSDDVVKCTKKRHKTKTE